MAHSQVIATSSLDWRGGEEMHLPSTVAKYPDETWGTKTPSALGSVGLVLYHSLGPWN